MVTCRRTCLNIIDHIINDDKDCPLFLTYLVVVTWSVHVAHPSIALAKGLEVGSTRLFFHLLFLFLQLCCTYRPSLTSSSLSEVNTSSAVIRTVYFDVCVSGIPSLLRVVRVYMSQTRSCGFQAAHSWTLGEFHVPLTGLT